MRARLATAGLTDVVMLVSSADNVAGKVFEAARAFVDNTSGPEGALLLPDGVLLHREFADRAGSALDQRPHDAECVALCHVLSDWTGVRWVGHAQNLSSAPPDKVMYVGALWVTRAGAAALVRALQHEVIDEGRLVDAITVNRTRPLLCTYPTLIIADPKPPRDAEAAPGDDDPPSHPHAVAFAGWGLHHFATDTSVPSASPSPLEKEADGRKRVAPDGSASTRANGQAAEDRAGAGVVRALWAAEPTNAALRRWRAMGSSAWLVLETSREGALSESEIGRAIVLDPNECRRVNPLHVGPRDTPETAITMLYRAICEAKQDHTHLLIEPLDPPTAAHPPQTAPALARGAHSPQRATAVAHGDHPSQTTPDMAGGSDPAKTALAVGGGAEAAKAGVAGGGGAEAARTADPRLDLAGGGVEAFGDGNADWSGWRTRLRAAKRRAPAILPPVHARWRFVPPHQRPVRFSARFLAVIARETGSWSAAPDIFLPTLCALQYGFRL